MGVLRHHSEADERESLLRMTESSQHKTMIVTQLHTDKINSRKNATKLAISLDEINTAVLAVKLITLYIDTSDIIPLTSEFGLLKLCKKENKLGVFPLTGLSRMKQ